MGIKSVKFRGRHNSWKALTVLIGGSLTLVAFVVMVILASMHKGPIGTFGIIGVVSCIIDLIGIIVSAAATRERDIYMSVPIAGMAINGFGFLLYVVIYVMGIV